MKHSCFFLFFLSLGHLCQAQSKINIISDLEGFDTLLFVSSYKQCTVKLPYSKKMVINCDKRQAGITNIYAFKHEIVEKSTVSCQLWLDADREVTLWLKKADGYLDIDSVSNAPEYAYYKNFHKKLNALSENIQEQRDFLESALKETDGKAVGIEVVEPAFFAFKQDTAKLRDLHGFLIRNKPLLEKNATYVKVLRNIEASLSPSVVNLENHKFLTYDSSLVSIQSMPSGYTVLDFWFQGCSPCREDHKIIKTDESLLTKEDIHFVGISIDPYKIKDKWKNYLENHQYNWPNYLQTGPSTLTQTFGIRVYPTYLVLDSRQRLLFWSNSYEEVKDFLVKK